ncbi:MAG: hypothetical protein M1330_02595 [Armatimonadetes bacterium]|nr:hypothetical protein [Armatimonadota bacterium]
MSGKTIGTWIIVAVVALIAINVLRFVLHFLTGMIYLAFHIAIIVFVVWLIYTLIAGRRTT